MQSALWAALYFAILMVSLSKSLFTESTATGQDHTENLRLLNEAKLTLAWSFFLSLIGAAGVYNLLFRCKWIPPFVQSFGNLSCLASFWYTKGTPSESGISVGMGWESHIGITDGLFSHNCVFSCHF